MPLLIKYIDKIARELQRDVLYVVFHPSRHEQANVTTDEDLEPHILNWDRTTLPIRRQIID